jgi:hypothetical protein
MSADAMSWLGFLCTARAIASLNVKGAAVCAIIAELVPSTRLRTITTKPANLCISPPQRDQAPSIQINHSTRSDGYHRPFAVHSKRCQKKKDMKTGNVTNLRLFFAAEEY